jgi:tetratricopeptide (TPR) repeat protein
LWAESYERDLKDVLDMQDDVARAIAREIKITLTPQEQTRLAGARPVSPQVYESYLKGRFFWRKFTAADIAKSIEYYRQAIDLDPQYAPAYAGLADAYALGSVGGGGRAPKETIPKAREAAAKALELDNSLGEAHLSLALVRTYYDWDWPGANEEFKQAIELSPNYAEAHHFYSHYYMALGRIDDSLGESKRALELDPLSPDLIWHLGWHYFYARQYDQAVAQLVKALELSPNIPMAHLFLGLAYEQKNMLPQSFAEYERVRGLVPGTPFALSDMGHAYAVSGNETQARKILDELRQMAKKRYITSWYLALVYTGMGQREHAFKSLQDAIEEHAFGLATLKVDPRLDPLRSDPRFQELLKRLGLPA